MEATPWLTKVSFVVFMAVFDVYFHGLTFSYFSPFAILLVVAVDRVSVGIHGAEIYHWFVSNAIGVW